MLIPEGRHLKEQTHSTIRMGAGAMGSSEPIHLATARPGVNLSRAPPFRSLTCKMGILSAS